MERLLKSLSIDQAEMKWRIMSDGIQAISWYVIVTDDE